MLKFRRILYPFSLLYSAGMELRNQLYDRRFFSSEEFEVPVIAVGNLSTGGTGKSPMIELLINLLKDTRRVASLSRGYKRGTSGFHLLDGSETAKETGDEPLQFKNKFHEVMVAVDEDRVHGIKKLLSQPNPPEVVLLDDAFQHRKVRAGFYILLTPYDNLFSEDLVLPAGNLREPQKGSKRANVIVVTKCPSDISEEKQQEIIRKLKPGPGQPVFFSRILYGQECFGRNAKIDIKELRKGPFSLVTGIANPQPLIKYLEEQELQFEHLRFSDHHNFTPPEIEDLRKKNLILTTEKDFMRLKNEILGEKLFYLPIRTKLVSREKEFQEAILSFVQKK